MSFSIESSDIARYTVKSVWWELITDYYYYYYYTVSQKSPTFDLL